jgi:hypothetical protein
MIKRSDEIQILLFIVQKGHENNYISSGVQKDKFWRVWNHQMELTIRDLRKSRTFADFDGHHSIQLYKGGIQQYHCPTTSMAPLMNCFTLLCFVLNGHPKDGGIMRFFLLEEPFRVLSKVKDKGIIYIILHDLYKKVNYMICNHII